MLYPNPRPPPPVTQYKVRYEGGVERGRPLLVSCPLTSTLKGVSKEIAIESFQRRPTIAERHSQTLPGEGLKMTIEKTHIFVLPDDLWTDLRAAAHVSGTVTKRRRGHMADNKKLGAARG